MAEYLGRCGEAFNIVIVGDSNADGDFYAIPYRVLTLALVDEYRTGDKTGRVRWVAYILHHQLKVGTAPPIDVGLFYGNTAVLTSPGEVEPVSVADANDYAIQNRRIEIDQRQRQSVFRKRVMHNLRVAAACQKSMRMNCSLRATLSPGPSESRPDLIHRMGFCSTVLMTACSIRALSRSMTTYALSSLPASIDAALSSARS